MANKKISELPYIDYTKISGNTLVPLVTYFSAVTGDTVHTYVNDIETYLLSNSSLNDYFLPLSGGTVSGDTIFTQNLTANTLTIELNIIPENDNNSYLGTPIKRFREINTLSGTATFWSATTRVYTPELDLGLDGLGNSRVITANNSIIQDDLLNGGTF
jgi:hypothetical protein